MPTNGYAHLDSGTNQLTESENPSAGFRRVSFTRTFADFAVPGLTSEINLIALPANFQTITSAAVVNTPGDSVATLTLSMGFAGINPTALITNEDALASAGQTYTGGSSTFINGPLTVSATLTSTGANLDTMTQGSWDFYISYLLFT